MSEPYGTYIPFSTFEPQVSTYLPEVPNFVADNAIRDSAIQFCEKTRYLQMDIQTIDSVTAQQSYQIITPADTKFVDIVEAFYNGFPLIPKSAEELTRIFKWVDWRGFQGNPAYTVRMINPEIQLVPIPQNVQPGNQYIAARIAIAPLRTATTCDIELYEHFAEIIGYGARARLMETVGQPYSDPQGAMLMWQKYNRGIMQTRERVNKALGRAMTRVEFAPFV